MLPVTVIVTVGTCSVYLCPQTLQVYVIVDPDWLDVYWWLPVALMTLPFDRISPQLSHTVSPV